MATITVRDIDDQTKEQLRILAAKHGHSMEAEVRILIERAVTAPTSIADAFQAFRDAGGLNPDEWPERPTTGRAVEFGE
jgi:antitoxin FitA